MLNRVVVMLALLVAASACTSDEVPEATESTTAAPTSASMDATTSPDPTRPVCDPTGVPPDPNELLIQLIPAETVAEQGQQVSFMWPDHVLPGSTAGDETVVECWTARGWQEIYAVFGIYGADQEIWDFAERDEILEFNPDAWLERAGTLRIPAWAPAGTYRFANERFDVELNRTVKGEGRFRVTAA